jgi:hypothetical protein
MITLSYGSYEATLRAVVPVEDERQFDQSMIVRRTRGGKLSLFRDSAWHDFDTIQIRSRMNQDLTDFRSLMDASWGNIVTMDVEYQEDGCTAFSKRYTGLIITPQQEIITLRDLRTFTPYSANFTSTSQLITTPIDSSFGFGTGDFTLSLWVKRQKTSMEWIMIKPGYVHANHGRMRMAVGDSVTYVDLAIWNGSSTVQNYTNGTAIPINSWHNVVMSRESGTLKLFTNGTQLGTVSAPNPSIPAETPFTFGTASFEGNITNVLLYNTALSGSHVTDLSNGLIPGSPIAHWPMDDGPGSITRETISGLHANNAGVSWTKDAPSALYDEEDLECGAFDVAFEFLIEAVEDL